MELSNPKAKITFERIKKLIKSISLLVDNFPKRTVSFKVGDQLIDAVTSIGANFIEAQSARSKKEFVSIINIVLRETKETLYWLELVKELKLSTEDVIEKLVKEVEELRKIFTSTILTASKLIKK